MKKNLKKRKKKGLNLSPSARALTRTRKLKLKKKRDRQKNFNKWARQMKENNILVGTYLAPGLRIFFNTENEHFFLEYIDALGRTQKLTNTFSVSFMCALSRAYKRAKKKKLIEYGRSIAPDTEKERITK